MIGRVVVVGSLNTDLVVRGPRLPRAGETVSASSLSSSPGGKGLNQAVAAARSGAVTLLSGAVGADDQGQALLAFLAREGIDAGHVLRVPGPSGTAVVLVDAAGENAIAVVAGANAAAGTVVPVLAPGDVVLLQAEIPEPTCLAAASEARRAGATVVLNLAPFRPLSADLAALVDLLVVNQTEYAQLLGVEAVPDLPATLGRDGTPFASVIVTAGAQGTHVRTAGTVTHHPAEPVDVTDTTGAGDCFCGALGAAVARRLTLPAAVAYAGAAAALSVTREGAAPAMPLREEVEALLGRDRPPQSRSTTSGA